MGRPGIRDWRIVCCNCCLWRLGHIGLDLLHVAAAVLADRDKSALFELRPPTYGNSPAFSSAMLNKALVGLGVELNKYFAGENTGEIELLKTTKPQHSRRGNRIFLNPLCPSYIHQLMAVCRPEDMRSGIPIAVPTIILHQARATTT